MNTRHYEFHTHTYRCKHAYSDFNQYIKSAIDLGITHLGFSDHCPYPDNRWHDVRMYWNELPQYIEQFLEAKHKFRNDIELYLGLECEYLLEENAVIQKALKEHYSFDFLSFGGHYTPYHNQWVDSFNDLSSSELGQAYFNYLSEGVKNGNYDFITHPDLYGGQGIIEDSPFIQAIESFLDVCEAHHMILEINARGLCKAEKRGLPEPRYPQIKFWERVSHRENIQVIVNSDAHHHTEVGYKVDECLEIVDSLNLNMISLKDFIDRIQNK